MGDARTIWHSVETRRAVAANRERTGVLIAFCLLCAMAAAEVLFLNSAASVDSVNMMAAAEGIAAPQ